MMRCSIKIVESIPFEPSGKFKKVISDIDAPPWNRPTKQS
jgi:hypothetical protein